MAASGGVFRAGPNDDGCRAATTKPRNLLMFAMLRRSEAAFDSRLINWITILGGLAYLSQSLVYAHTQFSLLDEGAYLYKGYLFATGQYRLYQDYGPWTNHMPLAFLIPGYVQVLFGPGLRTGRYLAVGLSLLLV